MKILITGINGFVGKELFKALNNEHDIIGIFNDSNKLFENSFKVDLLNESEVIDFCETTGKGNIDTVIHLSSKTANASNLNDISLLTINATLAKNAALIAKKCKAKNFINFSSASVYSDSDGIYNENSVTDPKVNSDCIYGLSKFNSEIIINHFLLNTGTSITHLRVAMIYGDGIDKTRLIPVLENEIKQNNSVTLFGNGERTINIISIEELVNYILFFIEHPIEGVINVSKESITVLDLAKRIISKKGNTETKINLLEKGNKSKFILDTQKLKNLLRNAKV